MSKSDILAIIVLGVIFALVTWLLVFGGKSYHYVDKNDSRGLQCVTQCNYYSEPVF